jgi:quinoprotein dehydrogenase-associated probable ABC transporter substrate-binding protein/PQQ-dependent catabolism-associated CXXCW motif protein
MAAWRKRAALALIAALAGSTGPAALGAEGSLPGELVDRDTLRVCSDPNNLPYSNEAGEGFENKIAELLAAKLGVDLQYSWYPSSVGFVRNTLGARLCDLVIGTTSTSELMQNTNPYYRSGYVLVQRAEAKVKAASLHDPVLGEMRIGAVARTPPVDLLARQGLIDHLVPYHLMVDTRYDHPAHTMIEDVAKGTIDAALVWGPIGGYFAKRSNATLEITPLLGEDRRVRLDFLITMGLRRGEPQWKDTLNRLLREHRAEIQAILLDYGVPLLDNQGRPIEAAPQPAPAPDGAAKTHGRLVPEPEGYRLADYRAPVPAGLAGARTVTTAELRALIAAERPVLVDVMPAPRKPAATSLWLPPRRDSLPGSAWLANTGYGDPTPEFQQYFEAHLARLTAGDRTRTVVFYCAADCWMSWNAAKRALALGYARVVWYPEGADGWAAAGLPLAAAEPVAMPDFMPLEPARTLAGAGG